MLLIAGWLLLRALVPVLLLFGIVILLAMVLNPLVVWLERRRVPRPIGAALVLIALAAIAVLVVAVAVPTFTNELQSLIQRLPGAWQSIRGQIADFAERYPALQNALPQADQIATTVGNQAGTMLRVELAPNGAFNVTEFGTVRDPDQLKALYAYSPYHHVTDSAKYPSILFMADILRSWKSFTANAINRALDRRGTVWMRETFDTIVRDEAHLDACRVYIEQNPQKARLSPDQFVLERRDILAANGQAGSLPAESGWKPNLQPNPLLRAKKLGFSDRQLAIANGKEEREIRSKRIADKITPTYRLVDTCAAEFEAYTPYYYSTYGDENERRESGKRKIMQSSSTKKPMI